MTKGIVMRLFYASPCGRGCCGCGPDPNLAEFEKIAEMLVKKFGEDSLSFEAYNSVDVKKFPFLREGKTAEAARTPAVTVDEQVVSSGRMPALAEIETVISKSLK